MGWGLRLCICHKLPGEANSAGPEITLGAEGPASRGPHSEACATRGTAAPSRAYTLSTTFLPPPPSQAEATSLGFPASRGERGRGAVTAVAAA